MLHHGAVGGAGFITQQYAAMRWAQLQHMVYYYFNDFRRDHSLTPEQGSPFRTGIPDRNFVSGPHREANSGPETGIFRFQIKKYESQIF